MNSHAVVATRAVQRVLSDVHEVWHEDLLVLKSASSQRARDDALRRLTKSHAVFGQALTMQQGNISKIGGAGSSSYVERLKDVEMRRQERVQAGGKRKTRYEGLIDWSNSADMPDITEQPTPCRVKQSKRSPAKDSMLDGTAQDYVQKMMGLEQTEPFRTAEECVRMLAVPPPSPLSGDCTLGGDGIRFPLGVWMKDAQQIYWQLQSCDQGYKILNKAADGVTFDHDAQTCELCGTGEECQDDSCTACTLCAAGKYKGAVGPQACEPCPVNTYRETKGATTIDDCLPCAAGSNTGTSNGQTSKDACVCDDRYYKSGTTCTECPPGAFCPDGTCALRSMPLPGACSGDVPSPAQDFWKFWPYIPGNWTQAVTGKFELLSCPSGFQRSSGTAGAEQCIKCLETQYIIDPNADQCEKCPKGLMCQGDGNVGKLVQNSTWEPEGGVIQCVEGVCTGNGAHNKVYVLKTCPTGYARISEQDDWQNQMCDPCDKGEECTKDVCEICELCKPGHYKTAVGTDSCLSCPANTYRERNPSTNKPH